MRLQIENPAVWIVAAQFGLYAGGWLVSALLLRERRLTASHWVVFNLLLGVGFVLIAQREGPRTWWAYGGCNLMFISAFVVLRRGMGTFLDTPTHDRQNFVILLLFLGVFVGLGSGDAGAPWRVLAVYLGGATLVGLTVADVRHRLQAEFGALSSWVLFLPAGLTVANGLLQAARQALAMEVPLELHREGLGAPAVLLTYLVNAAMFNFGFMALLILRLVLRLRELSLRDALTGLGNRRALEQDLQRETQRWRRQHQPFAVLVLDLDHFKRINDAHGHDAGDRVLKETARRMAAQARSVDTVARFGGEEFVLLMPQINATGAIAAAERLRQAVSASSFDIGARPLRVTVSVGVAVATAADVSAESVLARADQALYLAKAGGRDRVQLLNSGLSAAAAAAAPA